MNFTDELELARTRKKARGDVADREVMKAARERVARPITTELTFVEVIKALIDDTVRLGHAGVQTDYENPALHGWHVRIMVRSFPFEDQE